MKRLLSLACALLCLLTACGGEESPPEGAYEVWFTAADPLGGEGLKSEYRTLPERADPVRGLLTVLLAGPLSEELTSPFPSGVEVRGVELDRHGTLYVDLDERYGSLYGVGLTQADYCITLTLCQLPDVKSVIITVAGEIVPFRDRQLLTPEDLAPRERDAAS